MEPPHSIPLVQGLVIQTVALHPLARDTLVIV
jgi:hypothetical protein